MADRVKGITVEIGGNTTGLSKALGSVNAEIRNTQSNLKDVERLLKLDPTNTELLRQKQQLLSETVEETKKKLDSLKEAEKQVQKQFEEGKVSQQQYDALKREIIATENGLDDLEEAARRSNAALSKIGETAKGLSQKTETLASKTKGLSIVAGGALTAAAGLAINAGVAADDLNTLAKQTGFSTEQLQIWQYGADRVDVSMEDIVSSAAKMKKNMISTSSDVGEAWERLGISVTDSNGELRDSTKVFEEVVEALALIENETERDTLAMTLFGKSADSLAGLLDDGGKAFSEFGKEAKDAGLILSQETLDSANEFNDAIDTLKAKSAGTFAEIGAEIATMLIPLMDSLGEVLSDVMKWIRGLDEDQLKMVGTILLVVSSISPLLSAISKVSGAINTITTVVIPALSKGMSFIASNPIVLLIAAIVGLVTLIATKGDEIQGILQKVDDFLQRIFLTDWREIFGPGLGDILNGFFANLKNIWDSIKLLFDGIIDFIRGVFTGDWERAWNGVKKIFSGIFGALDAIVKAPLNGVIGLLNGAISAVNSLIKGFNKIGFDMPTWLGGGSWHPNIPTIPNIPYLATGGVVYKGSAIVGEAGPELLTVSGGKTIVQPLTGGNTSNSTHLGGVNIYIYAAPGQNVEELAELVSERIGEEVGRRGAVYA